MTPARIGVIGCGKVSQMYLPVLTGMSSLDVVAVADLDPSSAQAAGEQYAISNIVSPEKLLADPAIEVVLNLTPISAHVAVTRAALAAGKHVYSEKPLATSLQEARELVDEAERRGLALACAPDTLLGTGFQSAWQALADGEIGKPLGATAAMYRSAFRASSFYTNGATPIFDMAPYYASALVCLFGPVSRVSSTTRTWPEGETAPAPAAGPPVAVSGVLEFASGMLANLTLAWATEHRHEVPVLTVHGTTGVLRFPNPNNFGDPAYLQRYGEDTWTELPGSRQPDDWKHNLRGLGVAEMAQAIRAGRRPRAGADLACHVVDLIAGLVRSGATGNRVELSTTCAQPEPVPAGVQHQLLS
jgi:predicted dehydrogenase